MDEFRRRVGPRSGPSSTENPESRPRARRRRLRSRTDRHHRRKRRPEMGSRRRRIGGGAFPLPRRNAGRARSVVHRTRERRGGLTSGEAIAGLALIERAAIRSIPGRPQVAAAQRVAIELYQSAYDSLYLAVAVAECAVFVTAHGPFARAALGHSPYERSVRLIGASRFSPPRPVGPRRSRRRWRRPHRPSSARAGRGRRGGARRRGW